MRSENKTLMQLCEATWTIKETTPKKLEELAEKAFGKKEPLDGLTDFAKQTIYISRYLHPHRKSVVLVHEALHVIYERAGYRPKDEEKSIAALEHGVYELIFKYPDKYIIGDLQKSIDVPEKVEEAKKVLGFKPKVRRKYGRQE